MSKCVTRWGISSLKYIILTAHPESALDCCQYNSGQLRTRMLDFSLPANTLDVEDILLYFTTVLLVMYTQICYHQVPID